MSVTTLIKNPDVYAQLDELLPRLAPTPSRTAVVPLPPGVYPQRSGTAFDYALRFELARRQGAAKGRRWVAEESVESLSDILMFGERPIRGDEGTDALLADPERTLRRARRRVANARVFLRKHVARRRPDSSWWQRLAVHALKLARLDPVYRAGFVGSALFAPDSDDGVREIGALLEAASPFLDRWAAASPLLLNPTFGRFSMMVGGADCDVIAGHTLIDVKVSTSPSITRDMRRQLLVYMMLADEARGEGQPIPEIDTLAIYSARHATVWETDAGSVRGHPRYAEVKRFVLECGARC
jgi:hypothetical protein